MIESNRFSVAKLFFTSISKAQAQPIFLLSPYMDVYAEPRKHFHMTVTCTNDSL